MLILIRDLISEDPSLKHNYAYQCVFEGLKLLRTFLFGEEYEVPVNLVETPLYLGVSNVLVCLKAMDPRELIHVHALFDAKHPEVGDFIFHVMAKLDEPELKKYVAEHKKKGGLTHSKDMKRRPT
eukprot:Colp12_sorted_trinity150504_noHs@12480